MSSSQAKINPEQKKETHEMCVLADKYLDCNYLGVA